VPPHQEDHSFVASADQSFTSMFQYFHCVYDFPFNFSTGISSYCNNLLFFLSLNILLLFLKFDFDLYIGTVEVCSFYFGQSILPPFITQKLKKDPLHLLHISAIVMVYGFFHDGFLMNLQFNLRLPDGKLGAGVIRIASLKEVSNLSVSHFCLHFVNFTNFLLLAMIIHRIAPNLFIIRIYIFRQFFQIVF
jgi:hypothetical protein